MKKRLMTALLFGLLILNASAGEMGFKEEEKGLVCTVSGGLAFGEFKDQLTVYKNKNKRIDSLENNGESQSFVEPILDVSVTYSMPEFGTAIYFGSDSGASQSNGALGLYQEFGELGAINLGLIADRTEVWKNPYLLHSNREETDLDSLGFIFGVENILNLGLGLEYTYQEDEVKKDLLAREYQDLERDGDVSSLTVEWVLPISEYHFITPSYSQIDAKLDGKANAYEDKSFSLTYVYQKDLVTFTTIAAFGKSDYDKSHPLFNKVREDDMKFLMSSLSIEEIFKQENLGLTLSGTYLEKDSNINFYDVDLLMGTVSLFYKF